jgi:acetate kinase
MFLALNCGSSSVKYAVFDGALKRIDDGLVEGTGEAALGEVAARLEKWLLKILAIGHRVVHGGTQFSEPVVITPEVRRIIEELTPLAPEHQTHHIAGIDAMTNLLPDCPQIACFDTAFHRSIPQVRQRMALPPHFGGEGLLRYGFHGLSCQSVSEQFPGKKLIICHLGNGCSVTAVDMGESQYTSMGFTPTDGLMMGTRSGTLDPGAVLWLVEKLGSTASVRTLINREAGLKGVSGLSSDMRVLLASDDPQVGFAIDMFVDRLVLEVGRAVVAVRGFDILVFTGGIGENAATIRKSVVDRLGWLGVAADGTEGSRKVAVIHTDEEQVIAKAVAVVVGGPTRPGSSAG